jgi:predicted TIM-barrel fold metal-dependent hydrolase
MTADDGRFAARMRDDAARVLAEAKVDCHCHVLDPLRFPYGDATPYRPAGQEIGTAEQYAQLRAAYGIERALLVGPNSGYEQDNRCLLDALAQGDGCLKGIAVVPHDASDADLARLKSAGVIGVAFNATYHGVDYYRDTAGLLARLAALDMCLSLQVDGDQLVAFAPMLEHSGVCVLVDHCGRPAPEAGLAQPGFRALLALAATKRVFVKLSGYAKFARAPYPYDDVRPFVDALLDSFTPDGCLWATDWPFLRAHARLDVGPLLALVHRFVPDAAARHRVLWQTPCRVLDFSP